MPRKRFSILPPYMTVDPLRRLKIMVARSKLSSTKLDWDEEHPLERLIEMKVRRELKDDRRVQEVSGPFPSH